ncbi:macro domain-containing protein [Pseudomonas aeruginosa]|uniref:macro domain-containing protein n=1 Tax=Pseudomonas aeruginosa TaxID=287 RepID=UPI001F543176|nr:macro domain-containing protein [Pseudomonas aeruginosa]
MAKVDFFDKRVIKKFLEITAVASGTLSFVVIFADIPAEWKLTAGLAFLALLALTYLAIWLWSNNLNSIDINVEGSDVSIKTGDIFQQPGLKAIAFNEYFDTQVDNKIIGETSLNGVFIQKHLGVPTSELDRHIEEYAFDDSEVLDENEARKQGKKKRYQIGTIRLYKDYLLTAFSKFDENNKALLTMPEYLEFLINFWDKVNNVYAQKSVSTTIFGSGITRIKGTRTFPTRIS